MADGTTGGARRNSRTARRRRDARASRSPCDDRSRSAGRRRAARSIIRSRVTLATIEAAAIAVQRLSPWIDARAAPSAGRECGRRRPARSPGSGASEQHGPLHRPQRRLMDVDACRSRRGCGRDAPGDRARGDLLVEPLALERGHGLRVADARDVAVGIEHDGRRDDRPGQAAAADLVHAGDVDEPHAPERVLQRAERADLDHGDAVRRTRVA